MTIEVVSTQRGYFTDLVKGINTSDNSNAMQFNFSAATITSAFTVPTLGIPVVWDTSAATFVIYTDATAAEMALAITAGDSPLPGKAPIGIIVGNSAGAGFNPADVDFTAGEVATVFFRGANNAGVVRSGIDYSTATTSAANQLAFETQMEVQGVMVIDNAAVITPSFTQ